MDASGSSVAERAEWPAWLWLGVLLCLGTGLRLHRLGEGSMFIDEAESSLNALSILEYGYPADHYLGLPMFENTLTEPWPESAEYEFRDTSYSSRGMAIYHGWLPLYAIACSLWLHGIHPDRVTDPPRVQHSDAEIRRRILAARLPGVLFGALFLVAIFSTGRILFGVDAGLTAALAAALSPKCIWLAQQARYYSAALALSTLAVFLALSCHRHGRWRDFAWAGGVFVLLFHTSSLAFAIVLLASALLLPGTLRHDRAWAKVLTWAGILACGIVPWMIWTGYLENASRIPMARSYLDFPADYFLYLHVRSVRVQAGALLALGFLALWLVRRRLPRRMAEPMSRAGRPLFFLSAWTLVAYFGFQALVPAASCSLARLSHLLLAGPILLCSIAIAVLARVALSRHSLPVALLGSLVVLSATGNVFQRQQRNPYEARAAFDLVDHLRGLELGSDTRIFALPFQHFCLTYYTGLPIQTIAPVRKRFLEEYPGEILILETVNRLPLPAQAALTRIAAEAGARLDPGEVEEWIPELHAEMIRSEVAPLVREVRPAPRTRPAWVAPVVAELLAEAGKQDPSRIDFSLDNPAMFHDLPPMTIDEFWPAFFYRFVGPERRTGERLNYAGRMREASALLMPSSWIVLYCPRRAEALR